MYDVIQEVLNFHKKPTYFQSLYNMYKMVVNNEENNEEMHDAR